MKLNQAIDYLRSKNKYIVDVGCKFKPTLSINTDIKKTIKINKSATESKGFGKKLFNNMEVSNAR